jgi:hypothetical protein
MNIKAGDHIKLKKYLGAFMWKGYDPALPYEVLLVCDKKYCLFGNILISYDLGWGPSEYWAEAWSLPKGSREEREYNSLDKDIKAWWVQDTMIDSDLSNNIVENNSDEERGGLSFL